MDVLASLHDLIKQEASALTDPNNHRMKRHVQKLASAGKVSFTKQALLQDQNRFLSKTNNEARARQSIRSEVLGKAKVMADEDLEEARAKCAAKEKATADKGKGKRGYKRSGPALDVGSSELGMDLSVPKRIAWISEAPELAMGPSSPVKAPVARMY
jgi:hypothetical protein